MTHDSASALCQEYLWEASHYLVKQVFNSIKEMFSATRDIQVRSLLPFTSTFSSSLVHSYKGMLLGERWFSWPREDLPVPAQRCGIVPYSPVSTGLLQSAAGVRVAWEGVGSPSSTLTPAASSPLVQNWLTESAKLIAQSGRTVEWVTPLGLPIIQPYYRSRSTVVSVQCEFSWHTLPVPWWEQGKGRLASLLGEAAEQVGSLCTGTSSSLMAPCRAWSVWVGW